MLMDVAVQPKSRTHHGLIKMQYSTTTHSLLQLVQVPYTLNGSNWKNGPLQFVCFADWFNAAFILIIIYFWRFRFDVLIGTVLGWHFRPQTTITLIF